MGVGRDGDEYPQGKSVRRLTVPSTLNVHRTVGHDGWEEDGDRQIPPRQLLSWQETEGAARSPAGRDGHVRPHHFYLCVYRAEA